MSDDLTFESREMVDQRDVLALANALVASRLADGPVTSPESRTVVFANVIGKDTLDALDGRSVDLEMLEELQFGLGKFAMLAGCLADIAVEIIETGRRCDFNVSNLDDFLASPYLLPRLDSDEID
jgi:hypothetical protein